MKKLILLISLFVTLALFGTTRSAMAAAVAQEAESKPITETLQIPFLDDWVASGHADFTAEAFNHWNEEDPKEVPVGCAKCHSTDGYRDYVGADDSAVNVVDKPVPVGQVVSCVACHNSGTSDKHSVIMPSGLELTGLGDESRCMECHQGRESTISVNAFISETVGTEMDTVSEELRFRNIHYYAAAATKYGTLAKGGYEYDGKMYDGRFAHVEGYETCIDCHNSHTLTVKVDECSTCHEGVAAVEDLQNVRMAGSEVDYDGDGDVKEGIYFELQGMQELLFGTIQSYAADVAGTPIAYNPASYPYFFIDKNADGEAGEDEAVGDNGYNAWTARLLKAAYNYQTSMKDPGAFAHGGKYIIELLYDSMEDLNTQLGEPTDLASVHRIDNGHFAGSEEAFRHWDAEGKVPGSCAKCHSAGGLPMFLQEGVTISQPPANGFQCSTCHNDLQEFTRHEVKEVKFPSGATVASENPDTNLCMSCHQGRESGTSINRLIADVEADTVSDKLRFLNPHYFAAGATRYGTEAKGAYEYEDKTYAGFFDHANANECTDCHGAHTQIVDWESCVECHEEVTGPEDLVNVRYNFDDWDGDGDDQEGLYFEIETLREALYAAMQAYAKETAGAAIVYSPANHPYYFIDTNENGEADADEISSDNRYATWTPRLLRAAYNYQYSGKDPGAFTHNGIYIIQTLYDSLEDIGGDVSAMTRPE